MVLKILKPANTTNETAGLYALFWISYYREKCAICIQNIPIFNFISYYYFVIRIIFLFIQNRLSISAISIQFILQNLIEAKQLFLFFAKYIKFIKIQTDTLHVNEKHSVTMTFKTTNTNMLHIFQSLYTNDSRYKTTMSYVSYIYFFTH